MVTRVRKWGNSLGLRLPKSAADEAGLGDGSPVDVKVKNGEIVVSPVKSLSLGDMLARITPENLHGELGFGGPRGRERL